MRSGWDKACKVRTICEARLGLEKTGKSPFRGVKVIWNKDNKAGVNIVSVVRGIYCILCFAVGVFFFQTINYISYFMSNKFFSSGLPRRNTCYNRKTPLEIYCTGALLVSIITKPVSRLTVVILYRLVAHWQKCTQLCRPQLNLSTSSI